MLSAVKYMCEEENFEIWNWKDKQKEKKKGKETWSIFRGIIYVCQMLT